MNVKKVIFILIICLSLPGCGLVQRAQLEKQYKEQQRNSIFSKPGVLALRYVLTDDKIAASEGGGSLCPGGCSLENLKDKANQTPLGITIFYVAIHDYTGESPSSYKIDDKAVRYSTIVNILNNYEVVFGSSALADPKHVSKLYSDFLKEREYFGLNNISEQNFKSSIIDLYKIRSDVVANIRTMREQAEATISGIEKEKVIAQDKANPELSVVGLGDIFSSKKAPTLRAAFNKLLFVTRAKNTANPMNVYIHVGKSNLTLHRINLSIKEQLFECKRISAYTGYDIDTQCFNQVGRGLSDFADMVNNPSIPDLTKEAALGEASYDSYIDFYHAARLAAMHKKLCAQQGNDGYVTMVTVAAPCSGFKGYGN